MPLLFRGYTSSSWDLGLHVQKSSTQLKQLPAGFVLFFLLWLSCSTLLTLVQQIIPTCLIIDGCQGLEKVRRGELELEVDVTAIGIRKQ